MGCCNFLILVAESPETCTERREELLKEAATYLEEANVRFDAAVKIRKDYSNALVCTLLDVLSYES